MIMALLPHQTVFLNILIEVNLNQFMVCDFTEITRRHVGMQQKD